MIIIKVYIVNGKPESGKTTFEQRICDICRYDYDHIHSAVTFVKEIAQEIGWDGHSKTSRDRKFLSDLKDLMQEYNNSPLDDVVDYVDNLNYDYDDIYCENTCCFIDSREDADIEWLIEELSTRYEVKTVLVVNPNKEFYKLGNHADDSESKIKYDIIINNDSTLRDLSLKALDFVEKENLLPKSLKNKYFDVDIFGNIDYLS